MWGGGEAESSISLWSVSITVKPKRSACVELNTRLTEGMIRKVAAANRASVVTIPSGPRPCANRTTTNIVSPMTIKSSSHKRGSSCKKPNNCWTRALRTLCTRYRSKNLASRPSSFTSLAPPKPCCRCLILKIP